MYCVAFGGATMSCIVAPPKAAQREAAREAHKKAGIPSKDDEKFSRLYERGMSVRSMKHVSTGRGV